MSAHSTEEVSVKELWGGGRSPFSLSYGKQMMWFFLISDALTFGGLLITLGYYKVKFAEVWPNSEEVFFHFPFAHDIHLPLLYVALMTFILIVSSVTMVLAVEAGHRKDKKNVIFWMALTVIGGAIFVGSQAWEWSTFIAGPDGDISTWADNATMKQNPYGLIGTMWGPVQYSQLFFFITGFHGFHVCSGVVINFIILVQVMKGTYDDRGHFEMVEKTGLYWHFIDLVWVFVFTFFYLV
jgi:cytochrome c oxidase subunit 3